ncbi:sulfatase-like hydrolase/transferase [Vibrio sp. TH_r3]|uniref:sulfatase-like hydrolase/transferase n=1 Tax=Vibrio sp. TH_r3 TaxID=3082084 RepID=UPI0029538F34|nr:sulfatase-like hydrolase/transferase [Vibrio sp. TH_r3]MDV7102809.1 sulfatase-like hydrolase/transferase [Vibrio sp. TH_r3]
MMNQKFLKPKLREGGYNTDPSVKKPNMIFITVDMISPDCYFDNRPLSQVINTPNINAIAKDGTRFTRTYTTSPLCGPARAAMFTGMHPPYLTNGERAPSGSQVDLRVSDTIFQDYLKSEGYVMKHSGKCHVGVDKFIGTFGENLHAWDRWGPPLADDDRYLDFIDDMAVKLPRYRHELKGLRVDRETPANSFGGWIEQQDGSDFPKEAHYSTFLADLTVRQIKAARRQEPNQPFFAQIDFFDPHQPYSIPSGFEQRYQEIKRAVKLPASYLGLEQSDQMPDNPIYHLYRKYWGMYDEQTVIDYIVGHLLQVEVIDYAVGRIINYLKAEGLWDESVVVFSADHGDMNGRLGMADKGVYFQPDIFAIPLYLKPPKSALPVAKNVDTVCSALDIAPTLLRFAGIDKPCHMEGSELLKVAKGQDRDKLEPVFQTGMHVGMNLGAGIRIELMGKEWFYGYNVSTGYQELYDVDADVQVNQFYQTVGIELRPQLVNKMAEVLSSDPRWRGYWASYRLHNMEYLSEDANNDMQMLKPIY